MLPNFGQVRAWMMTPADVRNERPGPPPSTSSAQMQQELAEVKSTVEHLTREQLGVALHWNDGAGTYTPPGHWNDIAAEYVSNAHFSEVRAARAFALLNMAMHDAAVGCWDAKYAYFNPRPSQLDRSIKTSIGLPNFPSYTSGHSTFSAAAGRRALLPVPERRRELRGDEGRGRDLAALRRHPLPVGHRDRQGARHDGSAPTR